MAFQKGKSGNPGGRPKENDEVKRLAREHGPAAIKRLAEWLVSDNAKASVAAASVLLDRGYGKAIQAMEVETTVHYVARMPQPAKDMDSWEQTYGDQLRTPTVQ